MSQTNPAYNYFSVTKHDSTNMAHNSRGLYVGTGGDLVAVAPDDTAVTFKSVPGGTILPIVAKRVNSTNSTAEDIVAMY